MTRPRVFADTGVLLAMIAFPVGRDGRATLAGEAVALCAEGAWELVVSQVVVDELEGVVDRDFPVLRSGVVRLIAPLAATMTPRPSPRAILDAMPYASDPADAPVFAAAVASGAGIVLSNDFRAFHTAQAKAFWAAHGMSVVSLYGLLCVLGRRDRRMGEEPGPWRAPAG